MEPLINPNFSQIPAITIKRPVHSHPTPRKLSNAQQSTSSWVMSMVSQNVLNINHGIQIVVSHLYGDDEDEVEVMSRWPYGIDD
jgi:hypothetical protein